MSTPPTARPSGMRVYRDLLSVPHAARFSVWGVVGQFTLPMAGMGLLIGVRQNYGSFGLAGLVTAVMALSSAVVGPWIGHQVDARGQRRVTVPVAAVWTAGAVAMTVCLDVRAPVPVVVAVAAVLGANVPFGSMLRARWAVVLRHDPDRINSAFSLIAIMEEAMWVIGNSVAAFLATAVGVPAALGFAVVALALGVWGLVGDQTYEPSPSGRPGPRPALTPAHAPARERLLSPALVSLLAVLVAYGAFLSTTSLALVAFSREQGQQEWAGLVIASFSAASMLSAVVYGTRAWASPLVTRFLVGLAALAVGCSALLFSTSMMMAGVLMFAAGLAQAPTTININQMFLRIVPASRFTEGMAFLATMWVVGQSTASLLAGQLIDHVGSRGGFQTILGSAVCALLIALVGSRALRRETTRPLEIGMQGHAG